ncbi:T-box-containing protein TBX6L-like isoform X1 [Oncorhynchus keta]|uniref:T-box-containing protein TBX6L-like isoform X1 n=1 Tax=Oncorhynchus keta TaxID=8018 RepID=UPI0015F8F360|nr:T-box-containing protein TBX6L-like isoform X1 [Oncorhynchus keta]
MMTPSPLTADPYHHGNVRMTLEKSDLWKSFHNLATEMIITKHGRRMFPHCKVSLSGLQPYANYVLMVDMVPVDNFRYRWNKGQWDMAGKAEPQLPCRTYVHPDSPAPGSYWMKQSVSFLKLKLTNNTLDQHGHIILHSMHHYIPRFSVVQADSLYSVCWGHFHSFSFPETSFTAVTAYQNTKIAKLKIDHNPFAKGFKGEHTRTHSKRCRSNKSPGNATKKAKEDNDPGNQSPPDLQTPKLNCELEEQRMTLGATENVVLGKEDLLSPWALKQDLSQSHSLHTEILELHDHSQEYSTEEQMVPGPASMSYQPCRSVENGRLLSPSSIAEDGECRRSYESHVPDVATVPGQNITRPVLVRDMGHHHHTLAPAMPQDYRVSPVHLPMSSKTYPVHLGYSYPLYGHYSTDQGMGQWAECGTGQYSGPYFPHHRPFLTSQTMTTDQGTLPTQFLSSSQHSGRVELEPELQFGQSS